MRANANGKILYGAVMRYANFSELKLLQKSGANILDLRESDEFKTGHIPGAVNVPSNSLETQIKKMPKGKPLAIYCETSGPKTKFAASVLKKFGFKRVLIIQYGYEGWLLEKELARKAKK